MNIILAEVQPLSINVPDVAPESIPGEGNFTDLMEQQLNQDSELMTQVEFPQPIDIKDLIDEMQMPFDTDASVPREIPTPYEVIEYVDEKQHGIATELPVEPVVIDVVKDIINVEIPVQVVNASKTDPVEISAINPAIGAGLPVNGKVLPPVAVQVSNQVINQVALPVAPVQGDSLRQQKAGTYFTAESVVKPATDKAPLDSMVSRPIEIPGLVKTDIPVETFNFTKAVEFQVANNAVVENIETGLNSIRGLTPLNANPGLQPLSTTLPSQLETLTVTNPRDTPALGNGLGDRINWMVNQKLNTATIRMDPPMLGRLDVQIHVTDDVTNVTINTHNAQTRDMIDSASFRLREFLQENGYQNVNVDVSHQQDQRQQASEQSDGAKSAGEDGLQAQDTGSSDHMGNGQYFSSNSVVDYFA